MLIWSAQSYVTRQWLTLPLQMSSRCANPSLLATMHKQATSLHNLRLLLGTEAPIAMPDAVVFSFLSSLHRTDLSSSWLHVLLYLHALLFHHVCQPSVSCCIPQHWYHYHISTNTRNPAFSPMLYCFSGEHDNAGTNCCASMCVWYNYCLCAAGMGKHE